MHKYDYIIIGAGSAGCVLANRLSSNPSNQVLLLEAGGPDNHPYISIPGAYVQLFKQRFDWGFWTEPQKHVDNRKIYLPRGKTLGGCSSTNAMAYVRGNRADYDHWASLGNEGWGFKEVLPFFKKSEHHEHWDRVEADYHGKGGELHVSFSENFQTPYGKAFVEACTQAGIPKTKDYNGQTQTGASLGQFTIKNGKRHSGVTAFLKPAFRRNNFKAITHALVSRILIEKDRAVGVEFLKKGKKAVQVFANKEVILSAGAFHSPQILRLSGIGNKEELKRHHIDCLKDLPGVGQNLQDHLFSSVAATTQQQKGLNHYIPIWQQLKAFIPYLLKKKGPYSIGPLEAMAFTNMENKKAPANFQFHFAAFHVGKGYNYDMYDMTTYPTFDGFTILPSLVQPKSRGYVHLRSSNPLDTPIIQPNFLEAEEDLQQLIKGTKLGLDIIHQPAFDAYRKEVLSPPDFRTDDAIIAHIKQSLETIYHPVGTCKMGKDEMAVVDDQLRVHGIGGLRVVDASIMPKIVTGNTNAPVYMIAEKGADMILKA